MAAPLILITPQPAGDYSKLYLTMAYEEAIEKSGGIPLMCSLNITEDEIKELVQRVDGVLFSGGDDVLPEFFGEDMMPWSGEATPDRDILELTLFKYAKEFDKPIFGICRGIQLLNVATGGTVYQDLGAEYKVPEGKKLLQHSQRTLNKFPTQWANVIDKNSKIYEILAEERFMINSHHHQAVNALGEGWKIVCEAEDGVCEAMEREDMRFAVAVQWHPERLMHTEVSQKLLKAFVEACKIQ